MIRSSSLVCGAFLFVACSKTEQPAKPEAGAPAASVAVAPATPGEPGAMAEAGAKATAGADLDLTGTYSAKAAPIYMPEGKEWSYYKWRGDDAGVALGDGTMSVHIDGEGRVSGTLEGPLGPAVIYGTATAESISATVRLDLDADKGWTGTLTAARKGDAAEGTIQMSSPLANVARAAEFTLKKK
jgi:hypothetical protein